MGPEVPLQRLAAALSDKAFSRALPAVMAGSAYPYTYAVSLLLISIGSAWHAADTGCCSSTAHGPRSSGLPACFWNRCRPSCIWAC